jgi:hypothetical protein
MREKGRNEKGEYRWRNVLIDKEEQMSSSLKKMALVLVAAGMISGDALARTEGGVIINEIGNGGMKKNKYTGGDYVELLVTRPGGMTLAGWYLTDLASPSESPKEGEGCVRFSDSDSSIFRQAMPQGTYILICLGSKDDSYGGSKVREDVSLADGNNRIVVFAYGSPKHVEPKKGRIALTASDNVALLSEWRKNAAISIVTWGGTSLWTGCKSTVLHAAMGDNGNILYFVPKGKTEEDFNNTKDPKLWINTDDGRKATPGHKNPGVE